MRLLLIDTTLAGQWVVALCNTLIYSLLQGVLLAATTGLIVICTRKQTAALRYNLLVTALFVFTTGVVATFIFQLTSSLHGIHSVGLTQPLQPQNNAVIVDQTVKAMPTAGFNYVLFYLNSHSNTIVLVWFLIICAKTIQLGIGLYGTYRLKRVDVYAVSGYWHQRMQQFAIMLRLRQGVTLLESGMAKAPMVIGHLKPVILVPLGLLTNLTPGEVEAILMHELAHIRRRDFLVNLLQSLVEIIFFFNPAVLWVSQLIKTERENCCDDLALRQNNSKANYIRALLSCEQYRAMGASQAMAFPGSRQGLLHRVKRVANNSNHSLNLLEKTLLAACLVVSISGICLSAFAKKQTTKQTVNKTTQTNKDTVQAKAKTLVNAKPKKPVEPKSKTGLSQAGKALQPVSNTVPAKAKEDSIPPTPKALFNVPSRDGWIQQPTPQHGYNAQARMFKREDLANKKEQLIMLTAQYNADKHKMLSRRPSQQSGYDAQTRMLEREKLANEKNRILMLTAQYKDELQKNNQANEASPQPSPRTGYYAQPETQQRMTFMDERRHNITPAERQKMNDDMLFAIVADMLHDDIIIQKDNLDFKLTRDVFIVNGQQQDAAIQKRYSNKYVPADDNNDWTWTHSQHAPSHKE